MIGRAWSVKVATGWDVLTLEPKGSPKYATFKPEFKSGTGYNYGMLPPSYPVPAIPTSVYIYHDFVSVIRTQGRGLAYYKDDYETVWN